MLQLGPVTPGPQLGRDEGGNKVRWTPNWAEAGFASVSVPATKYQPVVESPHDLPNQTAPWTGAALPPGAPSPCPNCQGLTKDNLFWRTLVFWNLRQLLSLPADLCWGACWEWTRIYWGLALHFSEAEMSCNMIHHSLKKLPQADSIKGKYYFPHVIFNQNNEHYYTLCRLW